MPTRLIRSRFGYTLQAASAATSPADGTTIYFGNPSAGTAASVLNQRIYIPKTGVIRKVFLMFANTGTLGTNEASTLSVRVNNTTDYLISNTVTHDAAQTIASNTAMAAPVTEGDYIEIKWLCPTWATNPTAVRPSATIYIE